MRKLSWIEALFYFAIKIYLLVVLTGIWLSSSVVKTICVQRHTERHEGSAQLGQEAAVPALASHRLAVLILARNVWILAQLVAAAQ